MEMAVARCHHCQQPVDWVPTQDAARILGYSVVYVRRLARQGRFPGAAMYSPPPPDRPYWKIPLRSVAAHMEAR